MGLLMAVGCVFITVQTLQEQGDIFTEEFTNSRKFWDYAGQIQMHAEEMLRRFPSEEAVADGSAFEPEKQARLDQLEKDIIRTIQQHKNGLQDYIRGRQYNQDYYEPEYYESGGRDEVATTMVPYYYNSNLSDEFYAVVEGEIVVDEEAIRRTLTEQAQQEIRSMETSFKHTYEVAKQNLAQCESLKYAVVDMDSGRVVTNVEGDYKAAMEAMPWRQNSEGGMVVKYGGLRYAYEAYAAGTQVYLGFDEAAALAMDEPDLLAGRALEFHASLKTRNVKLAAVALLLSLCILCAIYLICVAGQREKGGPVRLRAFDRLWNFIHWTVGVAAGAFLAYVELMLIDNTHLYRQTTEISILCALAAIPVICILAETVLSIARHAKNKSVLKNTLWYKLWQALRGVRPQSMKRNTLLILLGFILWNFIALFIAAVLGSSSGFGPPEFLLLIGMALASGVVAYFLLLKHTSALDEIRAALRQAKQGNLNSALDPSPMPAGMKALAEGILDMRQGMDAAVRQAVAGERMRTELITNVSHDLKTPLTSVINYVDLLRHEDITEEERDNYLITLAQKSEQLGRLVEDLVEASKASSGNVELHPVEVNLHELALQAVGETSDALAAQGIDLIIQASEETPVIWSDSQKTWRIIENLMSNVKKYTMPGTRVYLQLAREGSFGGLIVKNISNTPLNMPAEELTQRFVRGDMARTGEGSGLGLSIADSLCKVQGGRFELQVDGDLFKAGVWLPLAG